MRALMPLIALALLAGCDNPFAPALDRSDGTGGSILGDQRQIEGVFQNFRQSYAFRDSTIYGQLLAPSFSFEYNDYDNGGIVDRWGRDQDIRTTHGLFQNTQRLDLVWNSVISSVVAPDSLHAVVLRNFNLTVTFSASDVVRVDGYAKLTMQRQAIGEVWMITQWTDASN